MIRFTIRDVLWLTVVVGLAVGWYVDRVSSRRTVRIQAEKLAAVRAWLAEAEDLLASEGVVRGEGQTIHTTPEHARQLLAERKIHR